MKILIGADENGLELKEALMAYISEREYEVEDAGISMTADVDYPEIAVYVACDIVEGKHDRGILICGTGIGMAIAANKVPGIRAAQCHDVYSAERAVKSNNAQIMTMGALVIGEALAKKMVDVWLEHDFDEECPSARKVAKLEGIDNHYKKRA